jgi:hypothetical protein
MLKQTIFVGIALIFILTGASAQNLPVVPRPLAFPNVQSFPAFPQYNNPQNKQPINPYTQRQPNPYNQNGLSDIQQRNQAKIEEDMKTYQQMQMEIQLQSDIKMLIETGFPTQSDIYDTSAYEKAFNEIDSMLNGSQPMNLGRAIFFVENAYYGDSLNYAAYRKAIQSKVELCNAKIKEEKLNGQDNIVKNMMLFSLLTDTMKIRTKGRTVTSYPLKYDLYDYKSEANFDSHFVTKLMRTSVGQCYSLPLYYLVLAEEMGAEAYWSLSPKHSFVKIKDENGAWYNLELTCGAVLTDAHYMNNSYIKAEALQHRIYLEPLDKTNTVARMLLELAGGYYTKYDLDDFYLKCVDTAAIYLSNNLDTLRCKSAYETRLTMLLANLLQAPNPEILKIKSPEAYKHYEKMQSLYKQIDDLGYEELPESTYAQWLEHIEKLKKESEKQEKMFILPLRRE